MNDAWETMWEAALLELAQAQEARLRLDRCGHPVLLTERQVAERRVEVARAALDALALKEDPC